MIHRVKTITYEVRSHNQTTVISSNGKILSWDILNFDKAKLAVKRIIWHLQDVLKLLNKLERERQVKKEKKGAQDERD